MKKIIKAPAKINLCIQVISKRNDGFHDLKMVMQSISLFDTIEFEIVKASDFHFFNFLKLPKIDLPKIKLPEFPKLDIDFLKQFDNKKFDYNSKNQINLKSNFNYIPTDDRNLVVKCAKYLFEKYNIKDKLFIYLKKMIPTCGGLGGGSSDAASIIVFLNKYYKLNLTDLDLMDIAGRFGSDIPFFIKKKECICEGRGEIVTPLNPFRNYYILLATPNIRVSTADIFKKIDEVDITPDRIALDEVMFNRLLDAIKHKKLSNLSKNIFNDLELATEPMFPEVALLKNEMLENGAMASLMSGSGPSVFGIFNNYFKVSKCKEVLKKRHPETFVFIARPL